MAQRKVIKQGNDTFTITIPRSFIRRNGIKAGDYLNVIERGNQLTAAKDDLTSIQKVDIELNYDNPDLFRWTFGAIYRRGFDEAKLHFSDPSILSRIQAIISKVFVGFIITEQTIDSCAIKSMTTEDLTNLDILLHRNFYVVASLSENCLALLKKKDYAGLEKIKYLHHNSDQLTRLCQRLLLKGAIISPAKSVYTFALLENLELFCDCYRDICNIFLKRSRPLKDNDQVMAVLFGIHRAYEEMIPLVFGYNPKKAKDVLAKVKSCEHDIEPLMKGRESEEIVFACKLKSMLGLLRNFFPTLLLLHFERLSTGQIQTG